MLWNERKFCRKRVYIGIFCKRLLLYILTTSNGYMDFDLVRTGLQGLVAYRRMGFGKGWCIYEYQR